MNKLMLGAAAVALTLAVSPAFAADNSGVKLGLGGFFKGYANYSDFDNAGTTRKTDLLRQTEVHVGGESTLDNGLTVGAHIEADADSNDAFNIDESYVYGSGAWGRVNVGEEDAAAYLLQVATPGADDNLDGIRPVFDVDGLGGAGYANDMAKEGDKLTYLSPVFSGLQFGASYTPHVNLNDTAAEVAGAGANRTASNTGVSEAAVRYEGAVGGVGVIAGVGYATSTKADRQMNVGVDLDIGAFGVGAAYLKETAGVGTNGAVNDNLIETADEGKTIVVGADYTTGPFKLGASYQNTNPDATGADSTDRYRAGVNYSYGPGMTFRGSVGYADDGTDDATTATVGTQINF